MLFKVKVLLQTSLLMACIACADARPQKTAVPEIARLGNVVIGVTPMKALERYFGPGLAYTGAHPQGGRVWATKNPKAIIDADGFDYGKNGQVVQTYWITTEQRQKRWYGKCPVISTDIRTFNFLGYISFGMSKTAIIDWLNQHKIPYSIDQQSILFHRSGFQKLSEYTTYTTWDTQLDFENGHLSSIEIGCS